ncbi:MAG TPA: hypothetical protein VNK23_11085 [Candidatus Dormibacteraeota bacterium]|nr:hypothetical protein [Candidatus Dormibacteraeota bacterium]
MAGKIGTGTVLVKNDAVLPDDLRLESEPYAAGWRMITDLDGFGLDHALQKTGWTFFCLAGEVKTTVFGIDKEGMLRRAVERLLAKGKSDGFNSLEITHVASVGSERFPLVRYVTVSAQWRQIQESMFLGQGKVRQEPQTNSVSIRRRVGIAGEDMALSRKRPEQSRAIASLRQ